MTDTCPNCLAPGIPPAKERRRGERIVHGYICRCGHRWATARQAEAYPAGDDQPKAECPTPGKQRFATREAALKTAARTQVPFGRWLNPYPCKGCGWTHLTSLAPPERYQTTKGERRAS